MGNKTVLAASVFSKVVSLQSVSTEAQNILKQEALCSSRSLEFPTTSDLEVDIVSSTLLISKQQKAERDWEAIVGLYENYYL
mgnify:CR=1 FL=1